MEGRQGLSFTFLGIAVITFLGGVIIGAVQLVFEGN